VDYSFELCLPAVHRLELAIQHTLHSLQFLLGLAACCLLGNKLLL
jgi:hypothetical protein